MPTNRDYTGLVRTPSSMAWLIRQRAGIRGRLERLLKTQRELPDQIRLAEQELAALDAVIPLHEVKVDPSAIKARRPHRKSILPYGVMTRGILECLREAKSGPLNTLEIALYVAKVAGVIWSKERRFQRRLTDRVRRRLKTLVSEGVVIRHHAPNTTDFGRWSLAEEDDIGDDREAA